MAPTTEWSLKSFVELSNRELYDLMKLRFDVFVVEQACIYPELDGLDTLDSTRHLLGFHDGEIIAYARAMAPKKASAPVKIGRVVTRADVRAKGVAREMMEKMLVACVENWPGTAISLSSQTQVSGFYQSLGFEEVSSVYIEDGIPHVDMTLKSIVPPT